jgi:septum formation protein
MVSSKRFVLDVNDNIKAALKSLLGNEEIVLASGSPRRREILSLAGVACRIVIPEVDESVPAGVDAFSFAVELAKRKLNSLPVQNALMVAADTLVVLENDILGKPKDKADAGCMLRKLSGHRHYVVTALAIRDHSGRVCADGDRTFVRFQNLSDAAIHDYVDSGEPMDKAGAYGIQGMGEILVESLEGSLHNVIGFPIELFVRMLREIRS